MAACAAPGLLAPELRELRLPADSSQLAGARHYAAQAAAAFGLDAPCDWQFVHAVNEAVTNAIRHGAPDAEGMIDLYAHADDERLTVIVRDYGTFMLPERQTGPYAEGGRGLALMTRFTDEVHLSLQPGATVISLSKARA